MKWVILIFRSSVGRKFLMALTGLFLCTFLVVHLVGNLLLLKPDGGAAFNRYAEFMATNGVIRFLEIGLVLGFLLHILEGIILAHNNWRARPVRYAVNSASENSTWTSRYMIVTGTTILLFLVVHLYSFTWKHRVVGVDEPMYITVKRAFQDPLYSGFYILAFIFLGLHLHHGFQSAFQSLGLNHKKYTPLLKGLGWLFCILVPLGYISIPTYFLLESRGLIQTAKGVVQAPSLSEAPQFEALPLTEAKAKEWQQRISPFVEQSRPGHKVVQVLKVERFRQFYKLQVKLQGPEGLISAEILWKNPQGLPK